MSIDRIFSYIDKHQDTFIENLKHLISIKSVSALPDCRPQCFEVVNIVANQLKSLGCDVKVAPNPLKTQTFPDGTIVDLPPIILASLGNDPSKETVCIYSHLDVQPAEKDDGWDTDPYEMVVKGDVMAGRGTTDDKGPLCGWVSLLIALKDLNIELDINLKFVFECMEETGSVGLKELLIQESDGFLHNIDYVCITDNGWLGTTKPCVTYGLRGVSTFHLVVSGPKNDLHSGIYGGVIHEPLSDLIHFLNQLVDDKGRILIPSIYDQVAPLTDKELEKYKTIDFDPANMAKQIGCTVDQLITTDKVKLLMDKWRYPCLSIHGIEGAFSQSGFKTVIPCKVIGKFSIRTVPNMTVDTVNKIVRAYIDGLIKKRASPNKVTLIDGHGGPPWVGETCNSNFQAAIRATKKVYQIDPDLTRIGGSIPVALYFEQITHKSVVLLPMGRGDDEPHSQNEKLNRSNYINGIKLFASYIDELSKSKH